MAVPKKLWVSFSTFNEIPNYSSGSDIRPFYPNCIGMQTERNWVEEFMFVAIGPEPWNGMNYE